MLAIGSFINQDYSLIVQLMELIILLWQLVMIQLTIGLYKIHGESNGVKVEALDCIHKTLVES